MANDIYVDDITPETFKQIVDFVSDDNAHLVDTSWLSAYDRQTMDMIARWRAVKETDKALGGDFFDEDDETAINYALSVAHATMNMLTVLGMGDDTSLFAAIQSTVGYAYEYGVRDACRGQLSRDAMQQISQHIDKQVARREAMLEFHKEVQQL